MKQVLISAIVAAVVSIIVLQVTELGDDDDELNIDRLAAQLAGHEAIAGRSNPISLSYTMELVEDGWVNGARTTGADHKPLAHSSNSICYLTKVEIKGIQGPEDSNACSIAIDDFTGFWQVTATVEEGGRSEVRCNARCLVWE